MKQRLRLGAVALTLVAAVTLLATFFAHRRSARTTPLRQPWLFVYNAVARDVLLLADPAGGGATRRTLDCLGLPRWALRVGVKDDQLVLLDPDRSAPALLLVDLERVRRLAVGDARCDASSPPVTRVPLNARKQPYRALLDERAIYVSYFGDNLVEAYDWVGGPAPTVRFVRQVPFVGADLGLSDLAMVGDKLAVASSGFFCYGRDCPNGHFHAPRLFFVDVKSPQPSIQSQRPGNLNSAGLYRHVDGSTWLINVGDYAGGHSSLQRVAADGGLGAEIVLPVNAAAGSARALDARHFVVLQMSGEHLFIIDAAAQRLVAVTRFDGAGFTPVSPTTILPDRSAADLQDLVSDGSSADRFFFVDAKGERLLHARWNAATTSLELLGSVAIGDERFRTSPAWAVWLPEPR